MRGAVKAAIAFQRDLHEREEQDARRTIEAAGCEIVELAPEEHGAFVFAVSPIYEEARKQCGERLFDLVAEAKHVGTPETRK